MATAKDAEETYLNYGDHCCFKDKNHGYMGSPVTSSHHAHLVVPDKLLEGISFQTHVFQIVAAEKYQQSARLEREMRTSIKKREQEHHQALKEANRKLKEKTKGSAQAVEQMEAEVFEPPHTKELLDNVDPKLLDSAMAEMNDNDLTQSRQFGFRLRYGDVVQLWHPFSRRFVRASTSAVAQLEPSHMKVSLDSRGTSGCQFIVLPRYKIRSVGDAVSNKDEIVFESVKSPGQFLNTSLTTLHSSNHKKSMYPIQNCHEISLSVNRSSFDIEVFSRPSVYSMRQYGATVERYIAPAPPITKHYDDTSVEHYLTAGMVLQLYNKDSESYISAEGSTTNFSTDEPARVSLDAHLRTRKLDERPSRKLAPTSAVTYFQVEKAEGAHVGGTIAWDGAIRLKHVPTQLYLAADESSGIVEGKSESFGMKLVTLNKETDAADSIGFDFDDSAFSSSGDLTVFQMFPEVPAQKNVPIDAYLRLKNKATGCWVHAVSEGLDMGVDRHSENRGDDVDHVDSQSFEGKISKVRWDKAELRHVRLTSEKYNPDAFSIKKVPDELVYHVNMIAGFIPLLHRFAHVRHSRDLNHGEASILAMELDELNQFMYFKGIQQKKRQKLLRSLQVIEVLMEMLKSPFTMHAANAPPEPVTFGFDDSSGPDRPGTDYSHLISSYDAVSSAKNRETKLVVDHVFKVLASFLVGDARKNEMYMCKHVPFLWGMFGTNMSVEPMFNELVLDNINIVQSFTAKQVERVVGFLEKGDRNANYLQLLSALCVCDDEPYQLNQTLVGHVLLDKSHPPVVLTDVVQVKPPESKGKQPQTTAFDYSRALMQVRMTETAQPVMMNDFVQSALDEDDSTSTPEYLFLQRQLELYGNLCRGRHAHNIELITITHRHLTWEECFSCAMANSAKTAKAASSPLIMDEQIKTRSIKSALRLPRSLRMLYVDLMTNLFVDVGTNRDVCSGVELSYVWDDCNRKYYADAAVESTHALSGAHFEHFNEVKDWINKELTDVQEMVHADHFEGQPKNKLLQSILNLLVHLIRFGYYTNSKDIQDLMVPLNSVLNGMNDVEHSEQIGLKNHKDAKYKRLEHWRQGQRYEMDEDGLQVMLAKQEALDCIESLFNFVFNVRLRFLLTDFKERKKTAIKNLLDLTAAETEVKKKGGPTKHKQLEELHIKIKEEREHVNKYLEKITEECDWVTVDWTIRSDHVISKDGDTPTLVEILLDTARYDYYPLLTRSMQLVDKIYSAEQDLSISAISANIASTPSSSLLCNMLDEDTSVLERETEGVLTDEPAKLVIKILRYYIAQCYIQSSDINREHKLKAGLEDDYLDDAGPAHFMNQQNMYNSGMLSIVVKILHYPNQPGPVLAATFDLMRALAHGYNEVQMKLFESLDSILHVKSDAPTDHTGRDWKNSMGLAMSEIFNGCKETCLNVHPDQVQQMLDLLVRYNVSAPSFVDALEAVAKVEEFDLPLARNQSLIMKSLMQHREDLMSQSYIDDKSDDETNRLRIELLAGPSSEMLTYHLAMVNLLASICEGENQQIEATCRSMFHLDELIDTIEHASIPNKNKGVYIKFLLWVYLNAAADKVAIGTDALDKDPRLLTALAAIASKELTQYYKSEGHPDVSWAFFAFDCFIPCLNKLLNNHATKVHKDAISSIVSSLVQFCDNLKAHPTSHLTKFRAFAFVNLMTSMKKYFEKLRVMVPQEAQAASQWVAQKAVELDSGLDEDHSITDYRNKYAVEIGLNDEFNAFAEALFVGYKGKNLLKDQLHISHFHKHHIDDVPYTESEVDDQAIPLGTEFQRYLKTFVDTSVPNWQSLEKSARLSPTVLDTLVRLWSGASGYQATVSMDERTANERVVTKTLLAVRAICHNEEILDRSTMKLQHQVVKHGAVLAVSSLISSHTKSLRQEALAIITAILKGGYSEAQKAFTVHFLTTREESFFEDINRLIKNTVDSLVSLRELRIQKRIQDTKTDELRSTMTMTMSGQQQKAISAAMDANTTVSETDDAESALAFDDPSNIRLVLMVLQSMCEGHNTVLQDYLRTQEDNMTQHNLIDMVAKFMDTIRIDASTDMMAQEILMQTVECLTEFAQGSPQNQRNIFDARVTDAINAHLRQSLLDIDYGLLEDDHSADEVSSDTRVRSNTISQKHVPLEDAEHGRTIAWQADSKVAQLLLAQLATDDPTSRYLATELGKVLDVTACLQKIRYYWTLEFTEVERTCLEADSDVIEASGFHPKTIAYTFYAVVARLRDFNGKDYHCDPLTLKQDKRVMTMYHKKNAADEDKIAKHGTMGHGHRRKKVRAVPQLDKVYNVVEKQSVSIEIMMPTEVDDGSIAMKLQKAHFMVQPEWIEQLREEVKSETLWNVDRASTADGTRDFTERCKIIIADMKYMKRVMEFSFVTRFLIKSRPIFNSLVVMVSFMLNLLFLIFWRANPDQSSAVPVYGILETDQYEALMIILGVVHTVLAFLVTAGYFISYPPSMRAFKENMIWLVYGAETLEKTKQQFVHDVMHGGDHGSHKPLATVAAGAGANDDDDDDDLTVAAPLIDDEDNDEGMGMENILPEHHKVFAVQQTVGYLQEHPLINRTVFRTQTSLFSGYSIYYLIFLAASIAGHFSSGYTFSISLLHIITGNQTYLRVLQSVTKNGKTLLSVFLLLFIVIYLYSLLTFGYYRETMLPEEHLWCETLMECFWVSLRNGLMLGGGLGEGIPWKYNEFVANDTDATKFVDYAPTRVLFDLSFFIIVTLIGLNVVFGIIVDTFSELRDEKFQIQKSMDNECFICGRSSNDFERKGNGFKHHVKHEHKMWNYLFFFMHLDTKDAEEYDDIEQYVAVKLLRDEYDFYPIDKALCLVASDEADDEDDTDKLMRDVAELRAESAKMREMFTRFMSKEKENDDNSKVLKRSNTGKSHIQPPGASI
eukprot:m.247377 g.247377  ORF g.247377 m.247377 type:complete len:2902 (-) comp33854_c0_seq12:229-8934(-)